MWLADATDSPATRFSTLSVPYYRTDTVMLAESFAALLAQGPRVRLDTDEYGTGGHSTWYAWTNVDTDRVTMPIEGSRTCANWQSTQGQGGNSRTYDSGLAWIGTGTTACWTPEHLSCFQQEPTPLVCGDGVCGLFETLETRPQDCTCGNGVCDASETTTTCPADCACGDGLCDAQERCWPCPADCGACPAHSFVFATSTPFTGNLGGVAGANAQCQTLAAAAGMPGPYKAWLMGPSGAPATEFTRAGPYVLRNGVVVAGNWADLTDGALASPINLTENWRTVTGLAWTGPSTTGQMSAYSTCSNWTSTQDFGGTGATDSTSAHWTVNYAARCTEANRLYCFEQESTPVQCGDGFCRPGETVDSCPADCHCGNNVCDPDEDTVSCPEDCRCGNAQCDHTEACWSCPEDCGHCSGYAYAFVTSTTRSSSFGGTRLADSVCQRAATNGGLPGTYMAWLGGAATRFTHLSVPYVRKDLRVIARDWADLTDGALLAPIQVDEYGTPRQVYVWTGLTAAGNGTGLADDSCLYWDLGGYAGTGIQGSSVRADSGWTDNRHASCSAAAAFYCFGQEVLPWVCGDGLCAPYEDASTCAADCGH